MSIDLKLEDLKPRESSFILSATGKTYHLNPIDMQTEVWMIQEFGGADKLNDVFKRGDFYKIFRIVYRIMKQEDKLDFVKRKVTIVNELGDSVEQELGGIDLFYSMVRGMDEKDAILRALMETIGISRPFQDKLIEEEIEAQKKRLTEQNQNSPLTG